MQDDDQKSFLDRAVSLRLVVVLILLGTGIGVLGAWAAVRQASGDDKGFFGKIALEIAKGPQQVIDAGETLNEHWSGTWDDRSLRVTRGPDVSLDGFEPITSALDVSLEGLLIKQGPGQVAPGWRFLAGGFFLDGRPQNAALLISPELQVVHAWTITELGLPGSTDATEHNSLVHGIDVLPDLSLVHTVDNGLYIQRIDQCSARVWTRQGPYHHSVQLDDTGETAWTLRSTGVAQVRVSDGEVLRHHTLADLITANSDMGLFEIHSATEDAATENIRDTDLKWSSEPVHFNDADPLPAAVADAFPMFEAGDVALSSRSLNAIIVIDPETAKVKWWRAGAVLRQHDPDWLPSGEIMVFDNGFGRRVSRIVAIDPATNAVRVIHDGAANGFYSRIRGKHQMLEDGTLSVTSAQQGRVFEIAPDGQTALEILSTKPATAGETDVPQNYVLSELRVFAPDFIDPERLGNACPP